MCLATAAEEAQKEGEQDNETEKGLDLLIENHYNRGRRDAERNNRDG